MEHEGCDKMKQTSIQFSCKKKLSGAANTDKSHTAGVQIMKDNETEDSGNDFESPTPEKPEWKSKAMIVGFPTRKQLTDCFDNDGITLQSEVVDPGKGVMRDSSISDNSEQQPNILSRCPNELPDKYKILDSLFNRMESSIRLLGLQKKLPNFQNICTQVEVLSKRKLLSSHLAQMKYVFPEAILIEKILIHDEKSLCMKPDMKITLQLDAVAHPLHPEQSASMALCQAFHARLLDFFNKHPEVPDIPEAMLPEPFRQRNHIGLLSPFPERSSLESPQRTSDDLDQSCVSHFPLSFHKQFSQKAIIPEAQRTQLLATPSSISTSIDLEGIEISKIHQKDVNSVFALKHTEVTCTPNRSTVSHLPENTPARCVLNSGNVMIQTPALQTPERPMLTPSEKLVTEDEELVTEMKLTHSARRSLIYSPSKTEGIVSDPISQTSEQNKSIQCTLNQNATTRRSLLGEEINESSTTQMQLLLDDTPGMNEGPVLCKMGIERRREMLACLPDILDTICCIARSINRSYITKEELLHKIISENLDIEDPNDIEEQLGLLEEFVPDWICKKDISSGGIIYSIKQTSDLESIRAKLLEAV